MFPSRERLAHKQQHHSHSWPPLLWCSAGNSLLFYGFGSKHDLLQRFARCEAEDGACLLVEGLTPGMTAKQVRGFSGWLAGRLGGWAGAG